MTQGIGAILVMIGAIAWHVASSGKPAANITDVWADIMATIRGTG